jgi:hypothetical protein
MDVVPNVSYVNINDNKNGKKPCKDIVHNFSYMIDGTYPLDGVPLFS